MANLAIQLYTVRDLLEQDYLGTVAKMKELGYEGVELPGGAMEQADATDLSETLSRAGLELAGIVFEHHDFQNRLEDVITYCKACGCKTAVYPWIPEEIRKTAEDYRAIGQQMTAWGNALKKHGIQFLYHVHGYEFEETDGLTGLDAWFEAIDADVVKFEIDVYWVEYAKVDSIEFMKKYGHLSPSIHFKDCTDRESMTDTEVGNGCIDMVSVAEIGLLNHARWFIVEQEQFDKPTVESAKISLDNLKNIRNEASDKLEL